MVLVAVLILLCELASGGYEVTGPVMSSRKPPSLALSDRPELQPPSSYAVLEERPLLSPTRRKRPSPTQTPPTVMVPSLPPSPRLPVLMGTLVSPERRAAIIRVDGGTAYTVAEGSAVAGWTLHQVQPGGIILRTGAELIPVKLTWNNAVQNTEAASLVADRSTMPMRGLRGRLGSP